MSKSGQTVRIEPTQRWVRAIVGGVTIADSKQAIFVSEPKHLPVYYFPISDVRMDLLTTSAGGGDEDHRGTVRYHAISVDGHAVDRAAWTIDEPAPGWEKLGGTVAFYWNKIDTWYEEDDEIYAEPRDPRHRVDVLHSSRHVEVVVMGTTVAESDRPNLLFETDLPIRYYLPRRDVRMDLLVPSETTSECPYKGHATYFSVRVGDTVAIDQAWTYQYPIPECAKIENLICFYNEQVDAIFVDGVEVPRPQTPWTRPPRLVKIAE